MNHQNEKDTQQNTKYAYKDQENSIDQLYEIDNILNASNISRPDNEFKANIDEGEIQSQQDEEEGTTTNNFRQIKTIHPARVDGENVKIGTFGVGILDLVSALLPYIVFFSVERSDMHTYLPDRLSIILALGTVVASHQNKKKFGIYYLVIYKWIRYVRLAISFIVVAAFSLLFVLSIIKRNNPFVNSLVLLFATVIYTIPALLLYYTQEAYVYDLSVQKSRYNMNVEDPSKRI